MKAIRNYTDALQVAQEIKQTLTNELAIYGDKNEFIITEDNDCVRLKICNTSVGIITSAQVDDIMETLNFYRKMYGDSSISFYIDTINIAGINESYYAPCWKIMIEKK